MVVNFSYTDKIQIEHKRSWSLSLSPLAYIVKIKENLEEYQNHINLDGMNK